MRSFGQHFTAASLSRLGEQEVLDTCQVVGDLALAIDQLD
jgi:hypothetical protein